MTAPINPAILGQLQTAPRSNVGGGLATDVGDQGAAFIQNLLEQRRQQEQQAFQQAQLQLQQQSQKTGVVERGLDRDTRAQEFANLQKDREVGRAADAGENLLDRASRERIAASNQSTSAASIAAERDRDNQRLEALNGAIQSGATSDQLRQQLLAEGLSAADAERLIERAASRRGLEASQSELQGLGRQQPGADPIIDFDPARFSLTDEENRSLTQRETVAGFEQPTVENLSPEEREAAASAFERFKGVGKSDEEATRLALLEVQTRRETGANAGAEIPQAGQALQDQVNQTRGL